MTNSKYWLLKGVAILAAGACVLWSDRAGAQISPASVRSAAQASGLRPLSTVPTPRVAGLGNFVNTGPAARTALVQLGKALFWDMQTGSDGQACASCHFHAGADSRARNQISPGLRAVPEDTIFGNNLLGIAGFPQFRPDYTLRAADFPLHQLADPANANFVTRTATRDTNDVISSAGVFGAIFAGLGAPLLDASTPFRDQVFNLAGINTRRVEPRNTPTMINAVFNFSNFWDGRAHNLFNGVSPIGPLDPGAMIWVNTGAAGSAPVQQSISIPNSSLASQAVGPPTSDLEMSFFARTFPFVGRKLLGSDPLGQQLVDPNDSVLGPISLSPSNGIAATYGGLIQAAFRPQYWNGSGVTVNGATFSQMEANFTLFFGLAVQAYETTLVSDRTPFDSFMAGQSGALSQQQLRGLLAFVNRGAESPSAVNNALAAAAAAGVTIGVGNCVACHGGPLFTAASIPAMGLPLELIEVEPTVAVIVNGVLQSAAGTSAEDAGFVNIGTRPTRDDLGRGGRENGFPLSFVRQALDPALNFLLHPAADVITLPAGAKVLVDGAFKVPGLRNAELTGPFFHNGGQATLSQVLAFYGRQGDFGDVNINELDSEMAAIAIDAADQAAMVAFLLSLTDERVAREQAPFDHPSLVVANGGTITSPAAPIVVPAVGAGGGPRLGTFLGLTP